MRSVVTLFISIFILSACASGSYILTGQKRDPINPSQVTLYTEAPEQFETIGIVKASSDSGWTQQGDMDLAVEELKNQAALLGANGALLSSTGEIVSTSVGATSGGVTYVSSSSAQTVSGKAIYVTK